MTDESEPKLGATGDYPQGKLDPTDEGGLALAISSDPARRKVRIDFGKAVAWIAFSPNDARALAMSLIERARAAEGQEL